MGILLRFPAERAALLLLLGLSLLSYQAQGQTIVHEETVPDKLGSQKFGQNRLIFLAPALGAGFRFGPTSGAFPIKPFSAYYFEFGVLFKVKVTSLFSFVADPMIRHAGMGVKQTDGTTFPTVGSFSRERFRYNALGSALSLRINFDPGRGNTMGKFLDLGAGANLLFAPSYRVVHHVQENGRSVRETATRSNLGNLNPSVCYAQARLGWRSLLLVFRYNLGKTLNPNRVGYGLDVSPYEMGLQFWIF